MTEKEEVWRNFFICKGRFDLNYRSRVGLVACLYEVDNHCKMNNSYGNIVYSGQIGETVQLQGQVEQHPHQVNNHHYQQTQEQQQQYHQETHNGVKESYSQERESIIASNTHAQGAYQEPEQVKPAAAMEGTEEVKNHDGEEEIDENHLEEEHLDPEEPENEEEKVADQAEEKDNGATEAKADDENGDAKEADENATDNPDGKDKDGEDDKKDVKDEVPDDEKPLKTRRRETGEPADLDICRVCTSKDSLSDIFDFDNDMRIADIIIKLCPTVRITERDHLPHKICKGCVEKVKIAHEFRITCENTDKELRKTLKRSYNKSRRTTDFVIVNCPMSDGEDDDDEPQDDDEYKVSQSEVESEPVTSDDSFEPSKKIKKTPKRRGRRPRTEVSDAGSGEVVVKRKRGRQPGYSPKTGKISDTPKRGPGRPPGRPGRPPKSASKSPGLANVVYIEAPDGSSSESDDDKPIRPRKTHDCNKCDETFKTGVELKEHLLTHKGDLFPCTKCDKTFKSKVYLSNHLERHEQDDKKREEKMKAKLAKKEAKRQAELNKRPYNKYGSGGSAEKKKKMEQSPANSGRDLFKCVAPLTSTYWSDSFSD